MTGNLALDSSRAASSIALSGWRVDGHMGSTDPLLTDRRSGADPIGVIGAFCDISVRRLFYYPGPWSSWVGRPMSKQSPRPISSEELRLVELLVRGSLAGSELLSQARKALVTEHQSDGWVLEFHHPSHGRMESSALQPVAEGYFGASYESAEAEVILFLDENGVVRDLEVFGYSGDAQRPFPNLDKLQVL